MNVVIKYGGSLLDDPTHRRDFLGQVAGLAQRVRIVLVHGGGKEISRQMEQAGLKPVFHEGRRVTDEAAMAIVEKALAGLNADLVTELTRHGAQARGYSGRDRHVLEAEAIAALGRVGQPRRVDVTALCQLLMTTPLPVFYSVAEDADRRPLNVNADDFALELARALRADRLVFLTDTGGVLGARGELLPRLDRAQVRALVEAGTISGGMQVKVEACLKAVEQGIGAVDIVKSIRHLMDISAAPEGTVFQ